MPAVRVTFTGEHPPPLTRRLTNGVYAMGYPRVNDGCDLAHVAPQRVRTFVLSQTAFDNLCFLTGELHPQKECPDRRLCVLEHILADFAGEAAKGITFTLAEAGK